MGLSSPSRPSPESGVVYTLSPYLPVRLLSPRKGTGGAFEDFGGACVFCKATRTIEIIGLFRLVSNQCPNPWPSNRLCSANSDCAYVFQGLPGIVGAIAYSYALSFGVEIHSLKCQFYSITFPNDLSRAGLAHYLEHICARVSQPSMSSSPASNEIFRRSSGIGHRNTSQSL